MTTYHLDPVAFRALVLNSDFMVAEMRRRVEAAHAEALATAPERTGRFKESLSTEVHRDGGVHHDRAEGILSSSDPAALSIEFGHAAPDGTHVDGHYTLTRALGSLGA